MNTNPWHQLSSAIVALTSARTDAERAARLQAILEMTRAGERATNQQVSRLAATAQRLLAIVREVTGGRFERYEIEWGEEGPPRGDCMVTLYAGLNDPVRVLDGGIALIEPHHKPPFSASVTLKDKGETRLTLPVRVLTGEAASAEAVAT